MKKTILLISLLLVIFVANSQTIYSKAFGDSENEPLIFLHGGPGYNSVSFEFTIAKKLSENGFYVIVYDRRGEGRSLDKKAEYTFQESFNDLKSIYHKYGLEQATLIGHSFGGVVATIYAKSYPEKVKSIVLVGVPLSMQETFSTIVEKSKTIYEKKGDSVNLNYIKMIENMDKSSIAYSSYSLMHAMQNGFYYSKNLSKEAQTIYRKFKANNLLSKYGSQMTYDAPKGFWENENYTSIDLTKYIEKVLWKGINLYGLYGKEDGLYSIKQIEKIKGFTGSNRFKYLENCSHTVFIDRQNEFINSLKRWIK